LDWEHPDVHRDSPSFAWVTPAKAVFSKLVSYLFTIYHFSITIDLHRVLFVYSLNLKFIQDLEMMILQKDNDIFDEIASPHDLASSFG